MPELVVYSADRSMDLDNCPGPSGHPERFSFFHSLPHYSPLIIIICWRNILMKNLYHSW
ncbi:hypothetical protein BJX63DRAFT_381911 [Aspergillus granulosus]|uniref:Actin n=1 Tax=Aspergillus granulosus TaxID=176169 RepID=A0ABR4HV77_9EURO